jgi:hypothetical protein
VEGVTYTYRSEELMDKPGEVVREEPEGCISMYTGANFLFL